MINEYLLRARKEEMRPLLNAIVSSCPPNSLEWLWTRLWDQIVHTSRQRYDLEMLPNAWEDIFIAANEVLSE